MWTRPCGFLNLWLVDSRNSLHFVISRNVAWCTPACVIYSRENQDWIGQLFRPLLARGRGRRILLQHRLRGRQGLLRGVRESRHPRVEGESVVCFVKETTFSCSVATKSHFFPPSLPPCMQCGTVLPTDVNHIDDPLTKEKLKAMMQKRNPLAEEQIIESDPSKSNKSQVMKEYFADRIWTAIVAQFFVRQPASTPLAHFLKFPRGLEGFFTYVRYIWFLDTMDLRLALGVVSQFSNNCFPKDEFLLS